MKIAVYDASTRRISQVLEGSMNTILKNIVELSPELGYLNISDAEALTESLSSYRELDGAVVYNPPPSAFHRIDPATGDWIDSRTLLDYQQARWVEIKAARTTSEFSSFVWDGSVFDADPPSQTRIQGASQLATLATMNSQPFSIDWTLADNSVRTLSAQDMIGVGMAMGVHINAQYVKARTKRAEIESATTPEAVLQVTW